MTIYKRICKGRKELDIRIVSKFSLPSVMMVTVVYNFSKDVIYLLKLYENCKSC